LRLSSLKSALLVSVTVVVVCSGLLISTVLTNRFSADLLAAAQVRAEAIAKKLALDLTDIIFINDVVAIQKILEDQIASEVTVSYLFIVTHDQQILAHTFRDGIPGDLIRLNQPPAGRQSQIVKIISETKERFIDVAMPIFEGRVGTLRIGLSEAPYRGQVKAMWLQMAFLTLTILGIALVVANFLINRLLRPLNQLKEAVATIDENSVNTRLDIRGREEVNSLTDAFNGMLDRLKTYLTRIRQSNEQLEIKHTELDRAHKQLSASLTFSQKIAALSSLNEIGDYIIKTLKSVVQCRNMTIAVLDEKRNTLLFISANTPTPVYMEGFRTFVDQLEGIHEFGWLPANQTGGLPAPEHIGPARRLAVFPFRYEKQLLGALLVACTDNCHCLQNELKVVSSLLNQTAGALNRALANERSLHTLRTHVEEAAAYGNIIGRDPKLQVVYQLIEDVAPTDANVLILGESGTGKELVAKAIHAASERRGKAFVVINCSAYPSTLLESELFGHEKGSFTGATRRKIGRFEQAHGGTVFLDEIGDISPTAQIKLLRVLQNHSIERVGGDRSICVDVRILAATNRKLEEEVKTGHFREDLFYRLNVIPIKIPPLRDRRNDVPLLANHFLKHFARERNKALTGISEEAMRLLLDHTWPGNVRELENSIEHGVVLAKSNSIQHGDFPTSLRRTRTDAQETPQFTPLSITENEEQLIQDALAACAGNKSAAAARLGISRSTLYEKLKKSRIEKPTLH
jgi:transcriptional regulator with GAF, ATPase, and Fis domain